MPNNDEILFKTEDPRGYQISLSSNQYYNHIVSSVDHNAHTEFTPDEIKECVEQPVLIWQNKQNEERDLYFAKTSAAYPQLYLKTVVAIDEPHKSGEVVTAFLSKNLAGGKDGGLRYVSYKSKL